MSILRTRCVEQGLVSTPDTRSVTVLEKIARLPFTGFNDVRLLVDGEETFGAIFDAIDRAQEYILVQFHIVRDDALGRELRDRLAARAREGVKVLFLYDEIGSNGLPEAYRKPLLDAGAEVAHFNSTRGPANRFQLNFRNHRKNLVIDGREAVIGGLNVGDEYMGRSSRFPDWRDTHTHVVGPVAQFAQVSFVEDWNRPRCAERTCGCSRRACRTVPSCARPHIPASLVARMPGYGCCGTTGVSCTRR